MQLGFEPAYIHRAICLTAVLISIMITSSNGNISKLPTFCAGNHRICAWNNSCVNNADTGDSRRHHANYDVIVMKEIFQKVVFYGMQIKKV